MGMCTCHMPACADWCINTMGNHLLGGPPHIDRSDHATTWYVAHLPITCPPVPKGAQVAAGRSQFCDRASASTSGRGWLEHMKSPAVELGLVWLCWPTPVSFFLSGAANGIKLLATAFIGLRGRRPSFRYYQSVLHALWRNSFVQAFKRPPSQCC
jgi:hypothetical protein